MTDTQTKSVPELLGVPLPPKNGRDRLVAVAIELFYRHGFNAIGIDRILAAAGVTKTTFYKHFEGKDELMVAAVLRRDEWETQAWERALQQRAGDDPVARCLAMLDILDQWFNEPEFRGCMFLNATVEFPNPHDPVHQAAAACKQRARDQRRDLAKAAGAEAAAAEAFADCLTAVLEGALVLRQMHGRNDAARVVRPVVEQLLATYLPKKPTITPPRTGRSRPTDAKVDPRVRVSPASKQTV